MPEIEEEELSLLYQAKGIDPGSAKGMAAGLMRDPQRALDESVREELGIGVAHATPLKEGWVTGVSAAVGAFIPVAPFLLLTGPAAIWTAFGMAMLAHFAVGAARSLSPGRGIIRGGSHMFVIALGSTAGGYEAVDRIAKKT